MFLETLTRSNPSRSMINDLIIAYDQQYTIPNGDQNRNNSIVQGMPAESVHFPKPVTLSAPNEARREREDRVPSRQERREQWRKDVLETAYNHGDHRDPSEILREAGDKAAILTRMWRETRCGDVTAERDEHAEVVALNDYHLFNRFGTEIFSIDKGTVLLRSGGRGHLDPQLGKQ